MSVILTLFFDKCSSHQIIGINATYYKVNNLDCIILIAGFSRFLFQNILFEMGRKITLLLTHSNVHVYSVRYIQLGIECCVVTIIPDTAPS